MILIILFNEYFALDFSYQASFLYCVYLSQVHIYCLKF